MKKDKIGPAALFVFALLVSATSSVLRSQAQSPAATEKARTLQMIASYRSWGKANVEPIKVSLDQMALTG